MKPIAASLVRHKKICIKNSGSSVSLVLPVRPFFHKTLQARKPPPASLVVSYILMWSPMPFVMKRSWNSKWITMMYAHSLKALRQNRMSINLMRQKTSRRFCTLIVLRKFPSIFCIIFGKKPIANRPAAKALMPCSQSAVWPPPNSIMSL